MGALPGRQEGHHGLLRSCFSQDNLQPHRADSRPPKHHRAFAQAVFVTCYLFPSLTTPFLSFGSLLRHHFLQEASLVPQPE